MIAIEARGITFSYLGNITALDTVSIQIPENGCVALLGSNGGGKSTLMRHLNGFLTPRSGDILVYGEPVTRKNLHEIRQKAGMVFQNPDDQIFAPTVREDVAFGPTILGLSPDVVQERVTRVLDLLEISHLADRSPHHLSGGEKKRVAIAGVLAMDPGILILDEPTSGLDPAAIRDLISVLRRLVTSLQKRGVPIRSSGLKRWRKRCSHVFREKDLMNHD